MTLGTATPPVRLAHGEDSRPTRVKVGARVESIRKNAGWSGNGIDATLLDLFAAHTCLNRCETTSTPSYVAEISALRHLGGEEGDRSMFSDRD